MTINPDDSPEVTDSSTWKCASILVCVCLCMDLNDWLSTLRNSLSITCIYEEAKLGYTNVNNTVYMATCTCVGLCNTQESTRVGPQSAVYRAIKWDKDIATNPPWLNVFVPTLPQFFFPKIVLRARVGLVQSAGHTQHFSRVYLEDHREQLVSLRFVAAELKKIIVAISLWFQ